jgi:hypothetical protein
MRIEVSADSSSDDPGRRVVLVDNTKNWYKKGTDLWAEFGNEIPFGRKKSSQRIR